MKRSNPPRPWWHSCALIAAFAVLQTDRLSAADQGYGPPQEQQSGFGDKIGGFFRHIFYGESGNSRSGGPPPPPQRGRQHTYGAASDRYNLDAPPAYAPSGPGTSVPLPDNEPPPPPNRRQEAAKGKPDSRSSEQKSKSRPTEGRKKPESTEPVKSENKLAPPPVPELKKTAPRETTPPVNIVNNTPPAPAPSSKTPEPEVNSAPPPPRNTPTTTSTPEEKETKVVQNNPPPSAPKSPNKEVLPATKTDNPNRVKSPYPPYTELDVTGLQSGSSALDPTSQRIFRVP